MTPVPTEHGHVGQRRVVSVSRAQKVWLERAAQALDELGVRHAHAEMAQVLREVTDAWRAATVLPVDDESLDPDDQQEREPCPEPSA